MQSKSPKWIQLSEEAVQYILTDTERSHLRTRVTPAVGRRNPLLIRAAANGCVGCIYKQVPGSDQSTLNDALKAAILGGHEHAVHRLIGANAGAWEGYETFEFPGGGVGNRIEVHVLSCMQVRAVYETYFRAKDAGIGDAVLAEQLRNLTFRDVSWAGSERKEKSAQRKSRNKARKSARKSRRAA
jgi:hypothetical protein